MNTLYMLTLDGNSLLDKPLTLPEIVRLFGPIQKLEKAGFRIISYSNIE